MLKKFFLNALSSFVGAWAAIVLLIVGFLIFIFGCIGSLVSNDMPHITSHSILKLTLGGSIEETETDVTFDYTMLMTGSIEKPQTLKNLVAALSKAKQNSDIEALYIECTGADASPATLDALRNAIKDFKESGKRVFAYGDNLSMGDYYVVSVADAVYLNPAGSMDLQGITGTTLYLKGLLDKVGIDVQAIRVGTFKSAIEPYVSEEMSEPARMQLDTLYNQIWGYILDEVSEERNVKASTINGLVDDFIFLKDAKVAKEYDLVDDCLYYRQVMDEIANYIGKDVEDLNFVSPEALTDGINNANIKSDDQIAVLYAVGEIAETPGAGINCHNLVPLIVGLANNDNVKGMVLRVNSPGGSVFGSEQIGEALDYFKSKGKSLAVSMGDYAASGGYWISAGADIIYADPLTITGSIGIFGLVPNIEKLVNNIGISPQSVSTNPGIAFPSIFHPMTPDQEAALRVNIEKGYEKFINRVAEGRHMSPDAVKKIAEGRVWSALQAKKIGLVDQLGGLQNAVDWVADKEGISSPNVVAYPQNDMSFWSILASSGVSVPKEIDAVVERMNTRHVDEKVISFVKWFLLQKHIQARCPYYKITL